MEKITITRALSQLKLLDKRITKAIKNSSFGNYTVGGKPNDSDFTPKEDFQKITDLIDYRAKIKSGIMKKNSTTKVKIGDKTMTVVDAIEMKDSIKYTKELLRKIGTDINTATENCDNINYDVQRRLDSLLEANFGKDTKSSSRDYSAVSDPFLERNEAKLSPEVDNFRKIYEELENEIDVFESEVDLVLSESNSTTFIQI